MSEASETAEASAQAAPVKAKRKYTKRTARRATARVREAPQRTAEAAPVLSTSYDEDFAGLDGEPLRRRSRRDRQEHRFGIPDHLKRPNWDYAFWPLEVLGQPVSRGDITDVYHGGWRPVPVSEMPEMMPPGDKSEFVEEGGQRLYKRPMKFTEEAKAEERALAESQTGERIRATARGQTRDGPGMEIPGVKTHHLGLEIQGEAGTYKGRRG